MYFFDRKASSEKQHEPLGMEVIEVNRKVPLMVLTLAVVLLATPYVGMVQAGKGAENQYFKLYMEGMTVGPPGRVWESDGVVHLREYSWDITGAFELWIGDDSPILLSPADYSGYLDINLNTKTGALTLTVHEAITVSGGTIEIMSVDKMSAGVGNGMFVGHGTGALEGVKVAGTTFGVETEAGNFITREGTVMGWP